MMIDTRFNLRQKCCFLDCKNLNKIQIIDNMRITHIIIEIKILENRKTDRTVKYRLTDSDDKPFPDFVDECDIFYTSEKAKFWIDDYLKEKRQWER